MKGLITKALKNKSIIGTVVVTIGLLANSFFSYLLQLFLGRNFSVADFGTYNALLSLFAIISVPMGVLSTSLVKVISELSSHQKNERLTQLFWSSIKFLFVAGLAFVAVLYLVRAPIASYMSVSDPRLYIFLGLYIAVGLLSVGPQAFLQGLMRFKAFSVYVASMGLVRLIVPIILVFMGYKVGGAYFGLALGMFLSFLLGLVMVRKSLVKGEKRDLSKEYKKVMAFTLPVLVLNLGMMSLNNIDVILVKKYFDAVTAGYYAGAVILCKVILFGAGSITIVMFPQISALVASGKSYISKFKFFLWIQLTVLLVGIVLYTLFPTFMARTFFGEQLLASAQYLPLLSVFISVHVLVYFILMFFIAINRTKASAVLIPAVVMQFVAINVFHDSVFTIIKINIAVILLILVTLGIYLYKISNKTAY